MRTHLLNVAILLVTGSATWLLMVNVLSWTGQYDPEAVLVSLRILSWVVVGGLLMYYPVLLIVCRRWRISPAPRVVVATATVVFAAIFPVVGITLWSSAKASFDAVFPYAYSHPTWLSAAWLVGLTWCIQALVSVVVVRLVWGRSKYRGQVD